MAQPNKLLDVVCLGCGCLCDDLHATRGKQGWVAEGLDCELGKQWLASIPTSPDQSHRVDDKPATQEAAFDTAAQLLANARRPLVCGLKGAATDAQRLAVAIADQLGGCVDWTTHNSDIASILAFQTLGASAASLGEVAQRADLVIFWQCDPAVTHPRHFERYSLTRSSPWLPGGRKDRTVVAVGPADTATAAEADLVIEALPEQSLAGLQQLRAVLAETELATEPDAAWQDLAERIKQSRYVAILYGAPLQQQGEAALGELTLLAQQAHAHTRVVTASLGAGDNATGAENVLAWQTGYPAAVSFSRGWPEYGLDDFTTHKLLQRGEVDAALVVSSAGLTGLSSTAVEALRGLPTVVLAEEHAADLSPTVELRVAPLGATRSGSVYRCDGIALPLTNELCNAPSHAEVLRAIAQRNAKTAARGP